MVRTFEENKGTVIRLFLAFIITAFTVPFITYDTGIRCIASPCNEAAARGGLVEFFAKSYNYNAYIIDYLLFVAAFIGIFILMEWIDRLASK